MTLTPEQLAYLEKLSADDGATLVPHGWLRELVGAYKRLAVIEAERAKPPEDWRDMDPLEMPRF